MSDIMEILNSKNCLQVIRLLLYKPGVEKYQAEIVKESGLSYVTATKCLNLAVSNDLLSESWKGGLKIYLLNHDSPIVKHLKILLGVSAVYVSVKSFSDSGFELYLYGSAARGEDTKDSDVDILIIGKADEKTLTEISAEISRTMNRKASQLVKTPIEFANLSRTNPAFYESIIRDRIRII